MINLKLAEYDVKTGKFHGFLELYNLCKFSRERAFLFGQDSIRIIEHEICGDYWDHEKDEKDPLNRFNGLFDGRTYGQGEFVLIQDDEDFGVYEQKFFDKKHEEFGYGLNLNGNISCTFKNASSFTGNVYSTSPKLIGNLMENPELYEKLK
jgi:hypothetical protein